jgi:hypothetical protein
MAAVCPPDSGPGTLIQLQGPSGGVYQVPVPQGVAPGQSFPVQLPSAQAPAPYAAPAAPPAPAYGSLAAHSSGGGGGGVGMSMPSQRS